MKEKTNPKVNAEGQRELEKVENQIDSMQQSIKSMSLDEMNKAPRQDIEQQTKIAQSDLEKMKEIRLKPKRAIGSKEKFNEDYRKDYEFSKEYVCFIAENKEIVGEEITMWTKPYAGMPAEEWVVPVNKPIWGPRYLAEQIKNAKYHRLIMQQNRSAGLDGMGQYYGTMEVDTVVQRLDAIPASTKKSIFMGSNRF